MVKTPFFVGLLMAAILVSAGLTAEHRYGTADVLLMPPQTEAPQWEMICDDAVATIYHAVPEQCNADVTHTASMFEIDPANVEQYRILAMERTMMAQYDIRYGDIVLIEGTDHDGLWQIQDTMNRRYKGKHKIDFLVPTSLTTGYWKNVKVYRPVNRHRQV